MAKQELLKLFQVAEETGLPLSTIQKHVREGKLKATRNGREYLVIRVDLNKYLGIESNDDVLKKDLKIAQLEGRIKSYEMQFKAIKGMVANLDNLIGL
ncbi:helix-turn-helix domain-containing protein [Clostridium beijerinckii]|uniref:Helix-turn-helix domain-containing protein n=1 Tax=Clostridium beijerinckii TaxID=1520 RepID=A0AAW3WDD8_CLOBE|nr:helix-turn-helix domain-containing protein [Clostridium beijerinckii]MBC2459390.1 helix-turn-helix domain-containing protein [Clostridium beijerinckii]MBC2476914.1 helix-turn-helix domain-containing protein [Clostridium beijerinckii]NOV62724.1 excisionase family DNA binding protein [Clostridium beijerinckii]NOV70314.1 excisionase family DNA binding protein [Clostridium beijerinckii]NOW30778.1 excisionase family DNA binding protein [Clostridium beijerinckii]